MKHPSPPWTQPLLLFLLFLASLAVYYPSLSGDLLNIDDQHYIPDNEFIRDLSWRGIYQIFTSVIVVNYFPLQILSYALDYQIWGLNPFGYRLTNLLFHIGNAVLVFYFLRHLLRGRIWLSFAGSLIFALHPVNVESVAWVSERKNVLSVFFLLLSFLAYIRYREKDKAGIAYGASLILYFLSVLAKVSSVIMPLLLILYDVCWTSRPKREWIPDKVPFFLISAFFSGLAVYVYRIQKIIPDYHGGHPLYTLLTMANVVVEYIISLIVPLYLNFYYDTPLVKSFWEYPLFLSLLFLLIFFGLAVQAYRRNKPLFFSFLWFFVPLLPVLNIVPIAILRADRYLYLSSVGFSFFLVWSIPKVLNLSRVGWRWVEIGAFCLIIGFYALLTERQSMHWQSTYTLWTHALKQNPFLEKASMAIGNEARERGQRDLAITCYREVLLRQPKHAAALNNLGAVYLGMGRMKEATDLLHRAADADPNYPDVHVNLGILHTKMGDETRAIAAFDRAKKDKKNRPMAENNLGVIYQKRGNLPRAIDSFRAAIQHDQSFLLAYNNLAMALEEAGQVDEAIAQLEKALEIKPLSFHMRYHLGRLFLKKDAPHRAAGYLSAALEVKPKDPDAHFHLAMALLLLSGKEEAARVQLEKAMTYQRDPAIRQEMEKKFQGMANRPRGRAGPGSSSAGRESS